MYNGVCSTYAFFSYNQSVDFCNSETIFQIKNVPYWELQIQSLYARKNAAMGWNHLLAHVAQD